MDKISKDRLDDLDPNQQWNEIDVGTRIDHNGKTTYHVLTSDRQVGYFVEKVYDDRQNLVRIIKRGRNSRSETDFHHESGDVVRIFEANSMPDGNSVTKELVYSGERATETVVVVGQAGELRRTVQRESVGIRTLYQGQTEYKPDGSPKTTINHNMDPANGKLAHREQIHWLKDGERALTEHFYFNPKGRVAKYTKILYHASGGPFLEETHRYGDSGHMLRREIVQFNPNGVQTAADLTTFDEQGEITQRSTTYYDHRGTAIDSQSAESPEEYNEDMSPQEDKLYLLMAEEELRDSARSNVD